MAEELFLPTQQEQRKTGVPSSAAGIPAKLQISSKEPQMDAHFVNIQSARVCSS